MSRRELGGWIKSRRQRLGLSQTDLAKLMETDQSTISRLERGAQSISASIMASISKVFEVPVDEIWLIVDAVETKTFKDYDDDEDVYITPPPAMIGTGTTSPSVSTALSRESTEVARRLDQLPTPERARALRYIRAILTQAENEAPAQHIEDQPKDAP